MVMLHMDIYGPLANANNCAKQSRSIFKLIWSRYKKMLEFTTFPRLSSSQPSSFPGASGVVSQAVPMTAGLFLFYLESLKSTVYALLQSLHSLEELSIWLVTPIPDHQGFVSMRWKSSY
jgi:hypothetical protein